ncbi:MAG: Cgl0159 family (beta/alpha)8-fold protein [Actinomycetes bacterium]
MREDRLAALAETRMRRPEAVAEAAAARRRPASPVPDRGRLLVLTADHPARAALAVGGRAYAMADRADLLDRLVTALARPGVDGLLGTPDVVEDLLLLGALHGKVVLGSMNRGGLAGSAFEVDDRFTAYDAAGIDASGLQGGKMLLRIDPDDPATARTLEQAARAVDALSARRLVAMVEPFWAQRVAGRLRNDLSPDAMVRAVSVASGLGTTSAYTWLKVPVVADMERVVGATTLPALILGGEVSTDQDSTFAAWERAVRLPTVTGLVVGRSLLYPPDDDVAAAVDTAAALLAPKGG